MSDETVLTKEIAEQFLEDEYAVGLNQFTSIEDAAAERLSKFEGENLYLNGLTELSDAAAESLSNFTGYELYLNGLTELSDAAADSFSKHKGTLRLPLFSHLNNDEGTWGNAACKLIAQRGLSLGAEYEDCGDTTQSTGPLWGFISSIQVKVGCGNCGRCECISVSLESGEYIGDVKPSLEEMGWKYLEPDNWPSDALIRCADCVPDNDCSQCGKALLISVLGQEKPLCMRCDTPKLIRLVIGDESMARDLELDGLTELSDATAESLIGCDGSLDFRGVTLLSDVAAKSLSKFAGDEINLDGLTNLSDAAAESLGAFNGKLSLNGLKNLSDEAAEGLSKLKGDEINLDGLTNLSDAAVESLSNFKGNLVLNGLTNLSDAAAESLSKFEGDELYLKGLTELSDAAAVSLSKYWAFNGFVILIRPLRERVAELKDTQTP